MSVRKLLDQLDDGGPRVAEVAAHLRFVLAEIGAGHLDAAPTVRDRLEAVAVALEALRDEPAPIDLDRLP